MNSELERTWSEFVVAYFEVLSKYLLGGTKKSHKTSVNVVRVTCEFRSFCSGNKSEALPHNLEDCSVLLVTPTP